MTDKYAVFGNPIAHSKSPDIHRQFAEQTAQDLTYDKQLVAEGAFDQAAQDFFAGGGKGLNITVPFKLDAYSYAAKLTSRARRAGAVNTLALQDDGSIIGDNTDGSGMVNDIVTHQAWAVKGKRVLILGAGGAVRGVLQPLLEQQPAQIVIANRTAEKAQQLATGFIELGELKGCGYPDLEAIKGGGFDLVINGTSASLSGELPPLPSGILSEGACCYDMMYSAEPTVFLTWAKSQGAQGLADGLGMLVGQAAEAFQLWRGQMPDVQPVIKNLRDLLNK